MVSKLLAALARELDNSKIPYMVIGGQAVLLYGRARFTEDIDITLGISPERFDDVAALALRLKLKPLDVGMAPREFAKTSMLFPCLHEPSGMRVDIVFSVFEYESQAIRRARVVEVGGYQVHFAAPEDLIIMKIIADRPRDLEDVVAVFVKNQKELDLSYIHRWLESYTQMISEPLLDRFNKLIAGIVSRDKE